VVTTVVFPWGILTKHVNKVLRKPQPFRAVPRGKFSPGYRIVEFSTAMPIPDEDETVEDQAANLADELDWLLNCSHTVDFLTAPHRIEQS
jgi:hypothetical protein